MILSVNPGLRSHYWPYRFRRLAPTPTSVFRRNRTPDLSYQEHRSTTQPHELFLCVYVEHTEKVVSESSTLTKNFYFPKILLEDLITRRNLYLVSLNAYLCEKYSSRVCHWAITATAAGIIHVNYYVKPWWTLTLSLIPSQRLNTVSCCFRSWTKKKIVQIVEATSREVVSIYWIDCIQSIIDGFFAVVVAIIVTIVAVCCIADVFDNVDEVDAEEKTPFKWWQQTQEEDTKRTQTGCVRHWLVRLNINEEQMFEAHINQQRPIYSGRTTYLPS